MTTLTFLYSIYGSKWFSFIHHIEMEVVELLKMPLTRAGTLHIDVFRHFLLSMDNLLVFALCMFLMTLKRGIFFGVEWLKIFIMLIMYWDGISTWLKIMKIVVGIIISNSTMKSLKGGFTTTIWLEW